VNFERSVRLTEIATAQMYAILKNLETYVFDIRNILYTGTLNVKVTNTITVTTA